MAIPAAPICTVCHYQAFYCLGYFFIGFCNSQHSIPAPNYKCPTKSQNVGTINTKKIAPQPLKTAPCRADSAPGGNSLFQGKQHHKAAQPEQAGSRVCAAGIRKGKVLRAVQGSQGRTAQTENRKAECCVLFPGGRTGAAGEIKECANDQPENRSGVPVPDSSSDQ